MSYRHFMKLLGFRARRLGIAEVVRAQKATTQLRLETLEDRQAPSVTPGTITGMGTTLGGQDVFQVDVAAAVHAGVPSFTGDLSFADAKAHVQFASTSISSIQINEAMPVAGPVTTNGYFFITGYATLNEGTASYSFSAAGALPFPAVQNSPGGLAFQVLGPNGYVYSSGFNPWDDGESITMTLTAVTPRVVVTSSANPAIVGQPVTFDVKVAPSENARGDVTGSVTLSDGDAVIGTADLKSGHATFTTSALTVGSHTITASYSGNSFFGPATGSMTEKIKPPLTPRVYISASANPALVNQPVTFTVKVTGESSSRVTGAVTLTDGTTVIGQANLVEGQAKFTTSTLTVGSHVITASYAGNGVFAPATASLTETIRPLPTPTPRVSITSSANPAVVGQPVTFKVTVLAGEPTNTNPVAVTGSVTLSDGNTIIGSAELVDGQASFTTSSLTVGNHTIIAKYAGNSVFGPAVGTLIETIRPIPTPRVTITSSANPAIVGQPVTFKVNVSAGDSPNSTPVTGSVTLSDGDAVIGTAELVNGQASFTTSTLAVGVHTISAKYSGNATLPSAVGTLIETIKPVAAPRVTITSSANPAIVGQSVTFKVTVSAGELSGSINSVPVTGSVTLSDGDTLIGTAELVNGQASFTTSTLTVGSHVMTAKYSGNATLPAATGTLTEVIKPIPTPRVTITSSANPAIVGQAVTFKVFVFAGNDVIAPNTLVTGSVTLSDGDKVIGTAELTNGQVSFTTSSLTVGSHVITAKYGGNNSYGPASGTLTQTIKPVPAPRVTITSSANPAIVGQSVTFKVTVSASELSAGTTNSAPVTGSVTLTDGDTPIGTADLVNGQASFTTSSLAVGSHVLTAKYSGNATLPAATGTLTEVIKPLATPKVTITSSANPATVGQAVTFKVLVFAGNEFTPNTALSGSVTLTDGTTEIGKAELVNGQASFTTAKLAVGVHTLTASYSGNATTNPATGTLVQTIRAIVAGTISGQGSVNAGQDTLRLNVQAAMEDGLPVYSGTLSFNDTKTGLSLTAASITSVQIYYPSPLASPLANSGYFVVSGTATRNDSTTVYTFTAVGLLPSGETGSRGGLSFQVTGPNGFSYSLPFTPWDEGQTITITTTNPPAPA